MLTDAKYGSWLIPRVHGDCCHEGKDEGKRQYGAADEDIEALVSYQLFLRRCKHDQTGCKGDRHITSQASRIISLYVGLFWVLSWKLFERLRPIWVEHSIHSRYHRERSLNNKTTREKHITYQNNSTHERDISYEISSLQEPRRSDLILRCIRIYCITAARTP
jgi:hypothetical protein